MGSKGSTGSKSSKGSKGPTGSKASNGSSGVSIFAALLVATTVLAYSNCFSSPFVLDDQDVIVGNPTIRSLTPISGALWGPPQSSTAGRPIVNLSFALNYAVHGLNPWGYHAVNLAIHILCGLILFGIIRRTLLNLSDLSNLTDLSNPSNLLAFFSALIWLLHPLQTEVVDYVTERTESLMALAYLTTLYAVVRGLRANDAWRWYAVAVSACVLGMLCKESMVTAPVMVLLYDAVFCAGSVATALRQRAGLYLGLGASYIVLAAVLMAGARSHSAGFSSGVAAWSYLLNQAPILVRYLRLAVWPTSLVFDYGLPKPLTLTMVLPAALAMTALFAVAVATWLVNRPLAYLGTWFFATLAPTSSIIPIATEVGAERRMYLPMIAIAVLAVLALRSVISRRAVLTPVLVVVSVMLGALTFHRNADYHDPVALWRQVIARYPHGRAHYNLGLDLKDAGRRDEAIHEYEIAANDLPDAEYALGFEAMNDGRYEEAIGRLRRYLQLKPLDINAIRASNLLGRSLLAVGRADEAATAFRDTLRMQSTNVDAMTGLGEALLKLNRLDEGVAAFRDSLRRTPDNPASHFNLGLALLQLRQFDEAATELSRAAALNPRDPAARFNLGTALVQLGRIDEAIDQFRQASAVESDPATREEIRGIIEQLQAEKSHK